MLLCNQKQPIQKEYHGIYLLEIYVKISETVAVFQKQSIFKRDYIVSKSLLYRLLEMKDCF